MHQHNGTDTTDKSLYEHQQSSRMPKRDRPSDV